MTESTPVAPLAKPLQATTQVETFSGLSHDEAALLLTRDGPNLLPGSATKSLFTIIVGVVTEPMFLMLLASVFALPFLREVMGLAPIGGAMIGYGLVLLIGIGLWLELLRWLAWRPAARH